jgi:tRNA nucleotidyltransferase (CCA-adding enzyme)
VTTGLTVILTHEHADFDALASMLAAWKLNPQAIPILPRQLNRNVREFLTLYRSALPFVAASDAPPRRVTHALVVDTQSYAPVRRMSAQTTGEIIDHHELQTNLQSGWSYTGDKVGATTTLLVERLQSENLPLTMIEATCLLLGIYEDTGALTYSATTARDAACVAWLLQPAQAANLEVVNRFLHHSLSPEQQDLLDQLIANSEPFEFGSQPVIIAWATLPSFNDEISTLAHRVRDFYEPAAVFLLVDLGDRIQIVARSSSDAVDVGVIASELGGGGHRRAAAALVRSRNLREVRTTLVDLLQQHVRPSVTVSEIMSRGLQTLTPDMTLAEAAARMQRFGFEGFPVADLSKVVGMLTRGQVDRALRHGLAQAPVAQVMSKGSISVAPEDGIEVLQRRMIESGWGQVPVVSRQTGALIGIVTRTDLIKLWGAPLPTRLAPDMSTRMESLLPPALVNLLRRAGEAAADLNYPMYAVGGFVRDLLLNVPNFDIDLVVEGDAINLARRLAALYGGRVRSHKRFGTAKWILSAESRPEPGDAHEQGSEEEEEEFRPAQISGVESAAPPVTSLDFVTARTEFYEHPTALPTVERSSIKLDLHRRDFTINTLAIHLDPQRWGELLDFYDGVEDLNNGIIRVLHSLSFIEDPTRILRAVRFEQRFQFQIEARTEQLIADALDLLPKVSPARVRHELELILEEAEPELALARLQQMQVLTRLDAHLVYDRWLADRFVDLRHVRMDRQLMGDAQAAPEQQLPRLYLALMLFRQPVEADQHVHTRLRLRHDTMRLLSDMRTLQQRLPDLARPTLRLSQIDGILRPIDAAARLLVRVASESWLVQQRMDLYERSLKQVTVELDGHRLRQLGLPPGPLYRQILQAVRAARLDGEVHNLAEEMALAQRLAERGNAEAQSAECSVQSVE